MEKKSFQFLLSQISLQILWAVMDKLRGAHQPSVLFKQLNNLLFWQRNFAIPLKRGRR